MIFRTLKLLTVLATLSLAIGCRKEAEPSVQQAPRARVDDLFGSDAGELVEESWEAHYVRGAKMGHRHRQAFQLSFPGADEEQLQRIVTTDFLEMRRYNTVIRQELMSVSIESMDGTVKQLGYRVSGGQSESTVVGEVVDGILQLNRSIGGKESDLNLAWDPSHGGIFAIEKSLAAHPMKANDQRSIKAFVPLVDRVVTYDLVAKEIEPTDVRGKSVSLLRIEATDRGGDASWKIPTVYWANAEGSIVKTSEAFLSRQTLLVDQSEATRSNEVYKIDLGIDVGVPLSAPLTQPDNTNYAVYRVRIDGLDPSSVFPNSEAQTVLAAEPGVALVTVMRVSPESPVDLDFRGDQPTEADLLPNGLIESDHPRVKALANAVVSNAKADPWRAATSLQRYLYSALKKNDYSQVFSAAGEVAQRKQGDCSEHAVLLAAACRAHEIPARVAIGMIYSSAEQSFLYHMWNEVWITDRWVPLDATREGNGTSAIYLKMRHSNLAKQSPYSIVSPIVHLMDRIKIDVVSALPARP